MNSSSVTTKQWLHFPSITSTDVISTTSSTASVRDWLHNTTAAATDASINWLIAAGGQPLTVRANPVVEPPPRGFNKYINASDLLEEFIEWLGVQGVRQSEVMDLPVELFIKWLIIRACEEDGEEPNVEMPALPGPKRHSIRCPGCGKFMKANLLVSLHEACAPKYFERQKLKRTA